MRVGRYVNGDIEAFTEDPKALIDELVGIHELRRLKYLRRIIFDFQEFLQHLFFNVRRLVRLWSFAAVPVVV